MECVICKTGKTEEGLSTAMFEQDGSIVVVKDIPAQVCAQCGEAYFSNQMSKLLYARVQKALESGTELEVIRMRAA
jgi:YgiT-type zinc finger domain-containing protein